MKSRILMAGLAMAFELASPANAAKYPEAPLVVVGGEQFGIVTPPSVTVSRYPSHHR